MNSFMILIGLPGSGKSTYVVEWIKQFPETERVSSDAFIEAEAARLGTTYNQLFPSYVKEATKLYNKRRFELFQQKCPRIIIDRTNLTVGGRAKLLSSVPGAYYKHAIVLNPSFAEILKVNNERKQFGRDIPEDVLLKMYNTMEIDDLAAEGFDFITYQRTHEKKLTS